MLDGSMKPADKLPFQGAEMLADRFRQGLVGGVWRRVGIPSAWVSTRVFRKAAAAGVRVSVGMASVETRLVVAKPIERQSGCGSLPYRSPCGELR